MIRIFPPPPPARLFALADLCQIAYDFGLADALDGHTHTQCLFPADTPARAAYQAGSSAGLTFLYQLTGQRHWLVVSQPGEMPL